MCIASRDHAIRGLFWDCRAGVFLFISGHPSSRAGRRLAGTRSLGLKVKPWLSERIGLSEQSKQHPGADAGGFPEGHSGRSKGANASRLGLGLKELVCQLVLCCVEDAAGVRPLHGIVFDLF